MFDRAFLCPVGNFWPGKKLECHSNLESHDALNRVLVRHRFEDAMGVCCESKHTTTYGDHCRNDTMISDVLGKC